MVAVVGAGSRVTVERLYISLSSLTSSHSLLIYTILVNFTKYLYTAHDIESSRV